MTTFILAKNDNVAATSMVKHVYSALESKDIVVTVKSKVEARKDSQRALGNIWYKDSDNFYGCTSGKSRIFFFRKFAIPIFERDEVIVRGVNTAKTIKTIRHLKAIGMISQYSEMVNSFVSLSTTSSLNIKQNSEYLNDIWNYCINERIYLSLPGDADIAGFKP